MKDLDRIFSDIYKNHKWGYPNQDRRNNKFFSGGGAESENDKNNMYVNLVQSYINNGNVKTVIEIGCGDWEIGNRIDWGNTIYTGYDVSSEVILYNQENFSKDNIKFINKDIINDMDIKADLLIIKDVIQHLPSWYSRDFVRSIPGRFKYNLITNDHGGNTPIDFGGYSGNDFSLEPFNMKYKLLIQWVQKSPAAGNKQTITLLESR